MAFVLAKESTSVTASILALNTDKISRLSVIFTTRVFSFNYLVRLCKLLNVLLIMARVLGALLLSKGLKFLSPSTISHTIDYLKLWLLLIC